MTTAINWTQLALYDHHQGGLIEAAARAGGVSRQEALWQLAEQVGLPVLTESQLLQLAPLPSNLEPDECSRLGIIVVELNGRLTVVLSDPLNRTLEQNLDRHFPNGYARALALPECISTSQFRLASSGETMSARPNTPDSAIAPPDAALPVSQRMQQLLLEAMQQGASDIHLENTGDGIQIKLRLDGVLNDVRRMEPAALADQMISRLKVMAELDIAERRVPQDGRFQARLASRDVDFRVSIMPGLLGEDAVIRILDRHTLTQAGETLTLDRIGFPPDALATLRQLIHAPYGMVLVTGPTGSGKTTTLYAALTEIHNGEDKIITIEDPVEYQLSGVLQIPVNERKGLTFARGLRSILRHDPDKIMVGEIRDQETAEIAVQAALTGHLVFTTVHANNVFDVIGRFAHMGVDAYNFVAALTGILAQRLVRTNCPQCSTVIDPDAALLQRAGLTREDSKAWTFRAGRGCTHCHGTGYKGRQAIAELLPLNDELRDLIIARAPTRQLKQSARQHGMSSLREAALSMVRQGRTTMQEVDRVTFME